MLTLLLMYYSVGFFNLLMNPSYELVENFKRVFLWPVDLYDLYS